MAAAAPAPAPDPRERPLSSLQHEVRALLLALAHDLDEEQLIGPRLVIVNPPLWELGHVAWFQERWVLRRGGEPSRLDGADALYDSSAVPHASRWRLPLPGRAATLAYLERVLEEAGERLARRGSEPGERYFLELAHFHECMHAEALAMTRQTLGYRAPGLPGARPLPADAALAGAVEGDVEVAGGTYELGARRGPGFVFDNEQWAHPVEVAPFRIARAPVTNAAFRAFVEEGGYRRPELWSEGGRRWLEGARAEAPAGWHRLGDLWLARRFDRLLPLEDDHPVVHVSWFEAEAWCRWAGRRLPAEAEWELAAAGTGKRARPWGDAAADAARACVDGAFGGTAPVGAFPSGDSPSGCRQMVGNVWEWTADDFLPFPGFVPGPYADYSAPWFGTHKVLRGGSWLTRGELLRRTWRNFYTPERRDVFAGFRTCAR